MDLFEILSINIPQEILDANKKEGRCSGHCCVGFTFPITIQDIKDLLEWRKSHVEVGCIDLAEAESKPFHEQWSRYHKYSTEYFEQLLDMFIEQDRTLNDGINPAYGDEVPSNEDDRLTNHSKYPGFFSCKHFNKENGDCMNYENRPDFCRSYPTANDSMCNYTNCTASCSKTVVMKAWKESADKMVDLENKLCND